MIENNIYLIMVLAIASLAGFTAILFFKKNKDLENLLLKNKQELESLSLKNREEVDKLKEELANAKLEAERFLNSEKNNMRDYVENLKNKYRDIAGSKDVEIESLKSRLDVLSQQLSDQKTTETKLDEMLNNAINKTLTDKNDSLLTKNKEAFTTIINPMKEEFEKLRTQTTEVKSSLEAQIKNQIEQLAKMTNEANNLTNALTTKPKSAGNYGEIILENVLNTAGLRKGIDYELQDYHITDDGKRVYPDAVINIPNNRKVIIDSKFSLVSYMNYESAEAGDKEKALKNFIKSVYDRVDELSAKQYDQIVKDSLDFVFMFIPNEAIYNTAVMSDPNMFEYAYKRKIAIISNATLYSVLLLIQNTIRVSEADKNIEIIRENAGKLFDKIHSFVEDVGKVGNQIDKAKENFDSLKNRLTNERKGEILSLTQTIKDDAGASSRKSDLLDNKLSVNKLENKQSANNLLDGLLDNSSDVNNE